jgi:hypothetical protein
MNWKPDNGIAEYDHNKPLPGESLEEAILRSATQNPRWKAYCVWPETIQGLPSVLDEPHISTVNQPPDLQNLPPEARRFYGLD